MARRPAAIAFDVIETLFPLEPLRPRLITAGQPGHLLDLWFTRLLRDVAVLGTTGGFHPFADMAATALHAVSGHQMSEEQVRDVVAGFAELDPHPDVEPALRRAAQAGVAVVTLTNGSQHNTAALLRRAGVDQYVGQVLSVEQVRRYKPAPQVYLHAARSCDQPPGRVALVAAHSWDTHGAAHAGLLTGWVSRLERQYPATFTPPDVTGSDLPTVVEALLALPEAG